MSGKPPPEVSEYLATIGSKGGKIGGPIGGKAGGARKRRPAAHYQAAQAISVKARSKRSVVFAEIIEVAREVGAFLDDLADLHLDKKLGLEAAKLEVRRHDLADRLYAVLQKVKR